MDVENEQLIALLDICRIHFWETHEKDNDFHVAICACCLDGKVILVAWIHVFRMQEFDY